MFLNFYSLQVKAESAAKQGFKKCKGKGKIAITQCFIFNYVEMLSIVFDAL